MGVKTADTISLSCDSHKIRPRLGVLCMYGSDCIVISDTPLRILDNLYSEASIFSIASNPKSTSQPQTPKAGNHDRESRFGASASPPTAAEHRIHDDITFWFLARNKGTYNPYITTIYCIPVFPTKALLCQGLEVVLTSVERKPKAGMAKVEGNHPDAFYLDLRGEGRSV